MVIGKGEFETWLATHIMNRTPFALRRAVRVRCGVWRRMLTEEAPKNPGNEVPHGAERNTSGPVTWRGLALFTALGTGGLAYYSRERERRINGKVATLLFFISFCSA